jgi:hypothetical protein
MTVFSIGKIDVTMGTTRRIEQIATRAGQMGDGISDAANPFHHADIITTMGDISQPIPSWGRNAADSATLP